MVLQLSIPICYSKISFPRGKEYGRIIGQHPSVHVDIQTKLVVFQPKIGQKIFGKNNETLIKEVQLLRQQIQVLQLRNELFSQKANLHQQPTVQNKSQKCEADFLPSLWIIRKAVSEEWRSAHPKEKILGEQCQKHNPINVMIVLG